MRLVAVVLNWNKGDDTVRALESLAGIETICVDNGSTDGSDVEVERRFPQVELVRTGAIDPTETLTKVMPIENAIEAYEYFDQRDTGWTKVELKAA